MTRDRPLLAALALLSAAVTAQQIALMQVLGWMHWHHFAYMVVAIALLGFGISGTVLSLARERFLALEPIALSWLFLATAVTIPFGVQLAQIETFAADLPLIFFDPWSNAWRLAALCLLLLPPFFCGGLVTGLILTIHAQRAGRFYAASLAGAGLGGLLGLAFVAHLDPPRLPSAVATLALLAALADRAQPSAPSRSNRSSPLSRRTHLAALTLTTAFVAAAWIFPPDLLASQFKPLRRTLDLPGARVIASRPGVHGWIQIVDAPALRPSPAVSFEFAEEIPPQPAVFINGLGYGSLLDATAARAPHWLAFTTDAAAFAVTTPRHVLLLENGPAGWAALAASQAATRVTVVEPNHALVDLLTSGTPSLAPEWSLPPVVLAHSSGRDFMRRTTELFDVIRFPDVGALGGTAGLASTSEQFLLTREAFTNAWNRLAPGGVIAVTAWMDFPERNPLRLLATLVETAAFARAPPRAHLAAVRGWATVTFLLRREPWNAEPADALRAFCSTRGFDPLLLPDITAGEREQYHAWQNPAFFRLVDQLVDGPREPLYRDYPFLLRPTSDDRPYFSQFLRWTKRDRLAETVGSRAMPFFELGSLTVALTFLILSGLAFVGIVLPLARLGWRSAGKLRVLLYFGGLGAGFMLIEIGLILRAHAWLGGPVLAAAVVITTLLLAAGAGSLWSERFIAQASTQRRALLLIAFGTLVASVLLSTVPRIAGTWPLALQLPLLLIIVAPLGAAMGTAFPLGLRQIESTAPAHIPWAWAINGSISVATPAAATLLAMTAGFTALFVSAVVAYMIALLSLPRK